MTASPSVESFRFETEYDLRDIQPHRPRRAGATKFGLTEDQILVGIGVLGIVLLFWRFTISLGAGLLAMGTFLWAMRERSRALSKRYEGLREPGGRVRVGATEAGYWIHGDEFFAECTWNRVINGFEVDGALLVQSWNMPRVYFPLAELHRSGAYDALRTLVEERSAVYRERMAAAKAPRD